MKFKRTISSARTFDRARGGFTLAEVLAALVFMAIVIPVAVQGVRVAGRAGQVGLRKAEAARVAERLIEERIVTGQWQQATESGDIEDGPRFYHWTVHLAPWNNSDLEMLSVEVAFTVQGDPHEVRLSTLVDPTEGTTQAADSTSGTSASSPGSPPASPGASRP